MILNWIILLSGTLLTQLATLGGIWGLDDCFNVNFLILMINCGYVGECPLYLWIMRHNVGNSCSTSSGNKVFCTVLQLFYKFEAVSEQNYMCVPMHVYFSPLRNLSNSWLQIETGFSSSFSFPLNSLPRTAVEQWWGLWAWTQKTCD